MSLQTEPLCDNLGVVVTGIDFAAPVSAELRNELYDLWLEHGILLIRGSNGTPESQLNFSRVFGKLEPHPIESIRSKEYPELMELNSANSRNNPVAHWDGEPVIGRLPWHKDLIYTARPNRGAVLRAVVIPEHAGETGYADQAQAYEALPEATKQRIADLQVVYHFEVNLHKFPFLDTSGYDAGPNGPQKPADVGLPDFPDAIYPLVLEHPETGRKILNVCPMFLDHIDNLDRAEGDELLRELVAHVTRPEFAYLHKWQPSDMILWDNWRFMHSAPGIRPGEHRIIHRTTILGEATLGKVA